MQTHAVAARVDPGPLFGPAVLATSPMGRPPCSWPGPAGLFRLPGRGPIPIPWMQPETQLSFVQLGSTIMHAKTRRRRLAIQHACVYAGADLGGGSRGSGPPLSYMKNDVMHTVIYAAFCMLPSLDLQDCTSF